MKKVLFLVLGLALVGCSEKKPLTAEEQWHGYCTSMGNAARSIMLDRQNAIEKAQAVEHAKKIEDEITRSFILKIIDEVYSMPIDQLQNNPDAARENIRKQTTDQCIATPHDKMPNYKPF
ncbi:hypothetical protein IAE19_06620 [Acinetobacter sp. S40]|uniref:hypothetical protein n=1 Tax=unclassified Acinetobacter TaxID=196816 RepID=UPI00190CCE6D|nr:MULTISPECIES: hypothetical protein [unclassified Acinetobacter]MBJ9985117.1 hypothetical protein [Acinetobacter sp. S40]MBK0063396.1 hypothetical protein [Acinetobacter sp. S55]MBK0066692.1 hypothetical protein [Acinetobacter sp. S54]